MLPQSVLTKTSCDIFVVVRVDEFLCAGPWHESEPLHAPFKSVRLEEHDGPSRLGDLPVPLKPLKSLAAPKCEVNKHTYSRCDRGYLHVAVGGQGMTGM